MPSEGAMSSEGVVPSDGDRPPAGVHIAPRELASWLVMMVGAAFVPGLVLALCVIVIVAVAHLVG